MNTDAPRPHVDRYGPTADPVNELLTLWILRLAINAGGWREMGAANGMRRPERLHTMLGFDEPPSNEGQFAAHLQQQLEDLERRCPDYGPRLEEKVAELRDLLGLTPSEADILVFLAFAGSGGGSVVSDAVELTLRVPGQGLVEVAAAALGLPEETVAEVLDPEGRLLRSGVLKSCYQDRTGRFDVAYQEIELKPIYGLLRCLMSRRFSMGEFFARFLRRADSPPAELDLDHVAMDCARLRALLSVALAEQLTGINVLITGEPGVGKTVLARHLAEQLGVACYEVPWENRDAEAVEGDERFHTAQIAQYMLSKRTDALLVFDEIEDVLDGDKNAEKRVGKAWTNRLLERSPVPTLWIANSVRRVDRSHLRRFDYLLELRNPPPSARRRMLNEALGDGAVSNAWLGQQVANDALTPAQIGDLGTLAQRLDCSLPEADLEAALADQLRRHQRLQGEAPSGAAQRHAATLPYAFDHLCAEPAPATVLAGLRRRGAGRVLMHGPAGTGKTAFAHALAHELDRPLVLRHASDLRSCLVGETERLLARMFEEAWDTGGVLFLDEADSFLQAREGAGHRWAVSETNELLAQLEGHAGITLMATNRIDSLDAAAMRRFDVRMAFDYIDTHTRWRLFERLVQVLGLAPPTDTARPALRARLDRLNRLAPGDFSTVARRVEMLGGVDDDLIALIEALAGEQASRAQADGGTPGFL